MYFPVSWTMHSERTWRVPCVLEILCLCRMWKATIRSWTQFLTENCVGQEDES